MPTGRPVLSDSIRQLEADLARAGVEPGFAPRTARLLEANITKMAKKLAEEAVEVALDAVQGDRRAVIAETVDLVYNLVVLLHHLDIPTDQIAAEMNRRRELYGIAAKQPKPMAGEG